METKGFHIHNENKIINSSLVAPILTFVTVIGFFYVLQKIYANDLQIYWHILLYVVIYGALYFLDKKGYTVSGRVGIGVLVFLVAIVANSYFILGLLDFLNQCIENFNYVSGLSIRYFVLTQSQNITLSRACFWFSMECIFLLFFSYVIQKKHWLYPVIMWILFAFISIYLEWDCGIWVVLFAIFAILGNYGYSKSKIQKEKVYGITLLSVFLVIFGISLIFDSSFTYKKSNTMNVMKEATQGKIDYIRYGENDFPEGKVGDGLGHEDKERLFVTMTKPYKLYLKSYVGGEFVDGKWEPVNPKIYGKKQEGMIQKYQKNGFHPLCQQYYYDSFIKETQGGLPYEKIHVSIENRFAYEKYMYFPYGASYKQAKKYNAFYQDINLGDNLFEKKLPKKYSFDVHATKQDALLAYVTEDFVNYEMQGQNAHDFQEMEEDYFRFVTQNNRKVPKKHKKELEQLLPQKQSGSTLELVKGIRKSLKDYGKDKKLDATEYASMGTLLFRMCQVPARYVEGYEVFPEDTKEAKKQYSCVVNASDAHAWVEIYLRGFGYVPVDVTPGHYSDIKNQNQNKTDTESTESVKNISQKHSVKEPEKKEESRVSYVLIILLLISVIIVLLIIFVLVMIILRKRIWNHRKDVMNREDVSAKIKLLIAYIHSMYCYLDWDDTKLPVELQMILQQVWYKSGAIEQMTEQTVQILEAYSLKCEKQLWDEGNWRTRIAYKYRYYFEFPYTQEVKNNKIL